MDSVNLRRVRHALITLTILLLLAAPRMVYPCGPYFFDPIFISTVQPEDAESFVAGKLGVPLRTYRGVYAFIAYRYLSGQPLTPTEQKLATTPPPGISVWWGADMGDDIKPWLEARAAVPGVPPSPKFHMYKDVGNYESIVNCTPDAFKVAARTLLDRIAKYGANSADVKEWVAGQDRVFAQCSAGNAATFARPTEPISPLPTDVEASAPAWLKKDRAYQIAAANFYAGNFDEAHAKFMAIADDAGSPWQPWGKYLAGRSLVRKATLKTERVDEAYDPAVLKEAETELKQVLADSKLQPVHEAARQVLGYVEFRLHPEEREAELAKSLAKPHPEEGFQQDLKDYLLLLGNTTEPSDDMSRWISTFHLSGDSDGAEDASASTNVLPIQEWEKKRTLPWLVLAMWDVGDPNTRKLLAAAEKVPEGSPGYTTVTYERARLEPGPEARKIVEEFLTKYGDEVSLSTKNLFLREHLDRSADFSDFLAFAERRPAATGADGFGDEFFEFCRANDKSQSCQRAYFDSEAAKVMDRMPLSNWWKAASDTRFEAQLRQQLALTTWCRAVLAEDWETANRAAALVKKLVPETVKYIDPYLTAKDNSERKFAAVFAMLHWPGIKPTMADETLRDTPLAEVNDFRMNWWCAQANTDDEGTPTKGAREVRLAAALLSSSEKSAVLAENKRVNAAGQAPLFLEPAALAWAKSHPDDPRVPEALHLAVTAGHLSCSQADSGAYSKEAFTVLHRRYPDSEWAKKTKYWYK